MPKPTDTDGIDGPFERACSSGHRSHSRALTAAKRRRSIPIITGVTLLVERDLAAPVLAELVASAKQSAVMLEGDPRAYVVQVAEQLGRRGDIEQLQAIVRFAVESVHGDENIADLLKLACEADADHVVRDLTHGGAS